MNRRVLLGIVIGVVVVAALVVGGIVAFGGDEGNREAVQAQRARALTELEGELLAPADLPAGYTEATTGFARVAQGAQCGVNPRSEREGRIATTRIAFQNSSGGRQTELHETLTRYTDKTVGDVMTKARALATDCATFTEELGGSQLTLATAPLEFPAILEETVAFKVTGTAGGAPFVVDQVFMRQGLDVVIIVHGGPGGVDTAVTQELARKAADKARA